VHKFNHPALIELPQKKPPANAVVYKDHRFSIIYLALAI